MGWLSFHFREKPTHTQKDKKSPSFFLLFFFVCERKRAPPSERERESSRVFPPSPLSPPPSLRLRLRLPIAMAMLLSAGPPELPVSISTPASPPQMLPLCPPYHRLLTSPETRMILLRPSQTQSSLSAGAEWRLSAARKEIPSFPLRFLFHFLTGNLAFLRRSPFYCLGIDFI